VTTDSDATEERREAPVDLRRDDYVSFDANQASARAV
jgi:hypothetical protein